MVVWAVYSEPVSVCFSLINRKLQGIFQNLSWKSRFKAALWALFQGFMQQIPYLSEQGIRMCLAGNVWLFAGNFPAEQGMTLMQGNAPHNGVTIPCSVVGGLEA